MDHNQPVLVIGANGFMGRYVYSNLLQSSEWRPIDASAHNLDILDMKSFDRVYEEIRPAGIINLAAISTLDIGNIPLIYKMNALAIVDILEYLVEKNFAGRFINTSSALVYGSDTSGPIDENFCLKPEHHYACAKAMADQTSLLYRGKLDVVSVRPFNCIGIGHKASFVVPKIIDHFREKKNEITLGNVKVKRDFVDVRDIATMFEAVLNAKSPEKIINFCSGRATSISDIVDSLRTITKQQMKVNFDESLVRAVENPYMCGDNQRLMKLPFEYQYNLIDTLSWMLHNPSYHPLTN